MRLLFSFPLLVGLVLLPVEALSALSAPAVREQSRPAGSLALRNVAFCVKIHHYGSWIRFPRNAFSPGQRVFLYADIDNFTSERAADTAWRMITKSTITICDKKGEQVQEMPFQPAVDTCYSGVRRDYYNSYEFCIPEQCGPGPHKIKLTIKDELSGQTASSTVDFIVK
ncbi:MAG TPA: hypothetical protein VGP76_05210 [Planctomycetaceae bacterium]|jgi:hypothetical protein|nr:hypothetical protein [Planctomycetaceae bacterium]